MISIWIKNERKYLLCDGDRRGGSVCVCVANWKIGEKWQSASRRRRRRQQINPSFVLFYVCCDVAIFVFFFFFFLFFFDYSKLISSRSHSLSISLRVSVCAREEIYAGFAETDVGLRFS